MHPTMRLLFTICVAIAACRVGVDSYAVPSRSVHKSSHSLLGAPTMRYLRSKKLVLEEERMHPFDLNQLPIEASEKVNEFLEKLRQTLGQSSTTENEFLEMLTNLRDLHVDISEELMDSAMLRRWNALVDFYNNNNSEHQITLIDALSSMYEENELIAIALQSTERLPRKGTPRRRILDEILQSWADSSPRVSELKAIEKLGLNLQNDNSQIYARKYATLMHYLDKIGGDKRRTRYYLKLYRKRQGTRSAKSTSHH